MTVRYGLVSDLLRAHQGATRMSDDQLVDLLTEHMHVTDTRVRNWLTGASIATAAELRATLIALGIDRAIAARTVEAHTLLTAVWNPATGAALQTARLLRGWSEEQAATAAGVSTTTIWRWEAATVAPRPGALAVLLAALGEDATALADLGDWPPAELPIGSRPALATWLYRTRLDHGLGQVRMSCVLGVAQGTLSAWETGRSYPAPAKWARLAERATKAGMPITVEQLLLLQLPEPAQADPSTNPVGAAIATARWARRLSRAGVAHLAGVRAGEVTAWETGSGLPPATAVGPLAVALELDPEVFADMVEHARRRRLEERTEHLLTTRYPGREDRGAYAGARIAALGVRARDVAAQAGVHRNVLSFWVTGKVAMPDTAVQGLAKALGVPAAVLAARSAHARGPFDLVARSLLEARNARGWTQDQVADAIGVRQTEVSAYERGLRRPNPRVESLLEEILEVRLAA